MLAMLLAVRVATLIAVSAIKSPSIEPSEPKSTVPGASVAMATEPEKVWQELRPVASEPTVVVPECEHCCAMP